MIQVEPVSSRPVAAPVPSVGTSAMLAVGAVVAVEAIRDTATNQLLLLFAGRRWVPSGDAAVDLAAGTRVLARVARTEPDLALTVLTRPVQVTAALRRELPLQGSPLRLLANLHWLAQSPTAAFEAALPDSARAALEDAWRSLPGRAQLASADGLEAAVRQAGLGLERQLAVGPAANLDVALAHDWKATLLRLHEALVEAGATTKSVHDTGATAPVPSRTAPLKALAPESATLAGLEDDAPRALAELAQQARAAMARVTCHQLAHLDGAALPLLVEIPYRTAAEPGLLRLRIDREAVVAQPDAAVWSVEFALDLGAHGPLRGRVTLAQERVSVSLRPERASLAQAIGAHESELHRALEQAGLAVGRVSCARGDPVDTSCTGAWLVDLRA